MKYLPSPRLGLIPGLVIALAWCADPAAAVQHTRRISVGLNGEEGNESSSSGAMSPDGRFCAFNSRASNLVPGDTNGRWDTFVHDRMTGLTEIVSVNSSGRFGNDDSQGNTSISADGRHVAYLSAARNLVPGDTNWSNDAFVHDRLTRRTIRVSVDSLGIEANRDSYSVVISADGRTVAFSSDADNLDAFDHGPLDVFVHNLATHETTRISKGVGGVSGNGRSSEPSISADGRFVAFSSAASNLVPGDANTSEDVFLHDRLTGITLRASLTSSGAEAVGHSRSPSLSATGSTIAFVSRAALLPTDTNARQDVYVADLARGGLKRASLSTGGSQPNSDCFFPSISGNGRFVSFSSWSDNLVPGDLNLSDDVFLTDLISGALQRVSISSQGSESNGYSSGSALSQTGRHALFFSWASNLIQGDKNNYPDVFVHDLQGLQLVDDGSCYGVIQLTVQSATPGGAVALVYGDRGRSVRSNRSGQSLGLGIFNPSIGAVAFADALGVVRHSFYAPLGVCASAVQAIDVESCSTSNPILLDSLPPFTLSRSGFCSFGQQVTVRARGAVPGALVAILHGTPGGSTVNTRGQCAGLSLELDNPQVLLVGFADAAGELAKQFTPPAALCGITLQAAELTTCRLSALVQLQ